MSVETVLPKQDRLTKRLALICLLGLGGFLLWGGFAPLEEGVSALGQIVVEGQRKVVQHLEGGIVRELRVVEGQYVEAGDVLVVLEDTASLASRDQVVQEYAALAASVERLHALQAGKQTPNFAVLDGLSLGAKERADIVERELDLFQQERSAATADAAVLIARRESAIKIQQSRSKQITIVERALQAANDELATLTDLLAQQLSRRDRVSSAQRQVAGLEADIARLDSERVNALSDQRDLEAQITAAQARVDQEVSASLLQTRAELLAAAERLSAAQDILNRSIIRAPVAGEVLNMQFATVGGVVRPGETILEIIPELTEVIAAVKINPIDRDTVFEGLKVRTQVSAYKGWRAPRFAGTVVGVSADLKTDPATSAVYYEAQIQVPAQEIERARDISITPGMPVDVFIYSGRSRTMFEYLLEPLSESLYKGLRTS